jgi:hypothetical protein
MQVSVIGSNAVLVRVVIEFWPPDPLAAGAQRISTWQRPPVVLGTTYTVRLYVPGPKLVSS